MDKERLAEVDKWFTATQQSQPDGTLALLLYTHEGDLCIGRGNVTVEMREFDLNNLPQVRELIAEALGRVRDGA